MTEDPKVRFFVSNHSSVNIQIKTKRGSYFGNTTHKIQILKLEHLISFWFDSAYSQWSNKSKALR